MANFQKHLVTAGCVGAAYSVLGHTQCGFPLPSCMLSAGLCTIGGLLPDLDSDNGVILRESLGLMAAVAPMLMLARLRELGLHQETIVLCAGLIYIMIRFGFGRMLKRVTVHRGMWHSIPAALVAGMIVYYLSSSPDEKVRLFKAGAIVTGYLWHLLLDEIYSFETTMGRVRVKRSFGTALKFIGHSPVANLLVYGQLAAASALVFQDPKLDQVPLPEPLMAYPASHEAQLQPVAAPPTDWR